MVNPLKGEVEFIVGDKKLTMCFPTDSIVRVEQLFGGTDIGAISSRGSVENMRALVWGALIKHHPDVDLIAASELLDDYEGGLKGAFELTARALRFRLSRIPVDAPFDDDGKAPVIN